VTITLPEWNEPSSSNESTSSIYGFIHSLPFWIWLIPSWSIKDYIHCHLDLAHFFWINWPTGSFHLYIHCQSLNGL
jgi:hypothetical protein